MDEIRVRILVNEILLNQGPEIYSKWIIERLRKSNIPIDVEGNILNGTIYRLDDPDDFGATIYVWKPVASP